MTLNIGHITYANCTPLFTTFFKGQDSARYSFIKGPPAVLNARLRSGEIDLCPSSSIEYALCPDLYYILPDLSISAIGAVKSVLLFSTVPIEELRGCEVGLTVESDTSVRLLQVILNGFYRLDATFTRFGGAFEEGLSRFPALLLIGDAALQRSQEASGLLVHDLGEEWMKRTGLPFVFALWLVRRQTVEAREAEVRLLHDSLVQAKIDACRSYGTIAENADERQWFDHDVLVDYWRTISYDLTPAHLDGLLLFYRYCADMNLIDKVPDLALYRPPQQWIEIGLTSCVTSYMGRSPGSRN